MTENVTNNLLTEVKEYLRLRKELAETELTIKVTQLISSLIVTVISIIFFTLAILFFVFSFVFYLRTYTGDIYAFIIGGAIFILLWILLYIFKKKIIVNPIAKFTNKIIHI